jgi:hypothetical protein
MTAMEKNPPADTLEALITQKASAKQEKKKKQTEHSLK